MIRTGKTCRSNRSNRLSSVIAQLSMCLGLILAGAIGCQGQAAQEGAQVQESGQDQAAVLAEQVMTAMGGWDHWNATRYLGFAFFGFGSHVWDRYTGRYRVSWTDRESEQNHVILMNLNTMEGTVYIDGGEVTDAEKREQFLERGKRAWINDAYWLLMPYKLQDPGVHLTYDGEEVLDGVVYDKLHLRFDDVGVTPDDEYWAYINRDTHLMDRWVYLLQLREGQEERRRGEWKWNSWKQYGNIMLSAEREDMDGQKRSHEEVAVYEQVDDAVFTSPAPVTPEMLSVHGTSVSDPATAAPE